MISLKLSRSIRINASRSVAVRGLQSLLAGLEQEAAVAEAGELVRDRLAPGVEQALDLPEADERPAAASSSVNVASATTAAGSWPNEEITSTTTAVSVASIGIARIVCERPDSIPRGRCGPPDREGDARDPGRPPEEQPAAHRVGPGVDLQRVHDVGRAEEGKPAGHPQPHRAAAQAADGEQAADHRDDEQVRGRVGRADEHRRESPCVAENTGLSAAASAVAAPAAPSAPSSQSALGKEPWSRRTRHTIAAVTHT